MYSGANEPYKLKDLVVNSNLKQCTENWMQHSISLEVKITNSKKLESLVDQEVTSCCLTIVIVVKETPNASIVQTPGSTCWLNRCYPQYSQSSLVHLSELQLAPGCPVCPDSCLLKYFPP